MRAGKVSSISMPAWGPAQPGYMPVAPSDTATRTDPLRVVLFLIVFLAIGRMHQHYPVLSLFRPAFVLVGLATILAIMQPKYLNRTAIFKSWHAKIVAAIGIMACISAPLGISLGASASFILSTFWKTLLLCFLLMAATRHTRDLKTFCLAFILGCIFLLYLSLFFFQLSSGGGAATRLNDLYMWDANDITSLLVIGFGLIALFAQTSTGWMRYGALLLMFAVGGAIARSGSRGGFVGFAVVAAALLIALNRVSVGKRLAFVGLIGLGLGLFAPPGYWTQMQTIFNPTADYNWTDEEGRRQIWSRGMGYMLDYPIAGVGINNFERAECMISSKAQTHVEGTGLKCTPPHNSYLQMGAELGFPGLTLWLVMVFGGIVKMIQLAKRIPHHWERGDGEARFLYHAPRYLAICMIGFAVTSFFLSHAYLDPVYVLIAFMAGAYTAVGERMRREQAAGAMFVGPMPGGMPMPHVAPVPRGRGGLNRLR